LCSPSICEGYCSFVLIMLFVFAVIISIDKRALHYDVISFIPRRRIASHRLAQTCRSLRIPIASAGDVKSRHARRHTRSFKIFGWLGMDETIRNIRETCGKRVGCLKWILTMCRIIGIVMGTRNHNPTTCERCGIAHQFYSTSTVIAGTCDTGNLD
jgi:hypothetical protein